MAGLPRSAADPVRTTDTVPRMSLRNVVVVMNESAGRASSDTDSERDEIEQTFADLGVAATVARLRPTEMAEKIGLFWADHPRPDAIVVAGGDGTINCAANAVAGTDVVLGVVPTGTFNHFAKDIGMPVEVEAAVRALVDATPRRVDVGEVNGRLFVNNSVIGVYPEMVAIRDKLRSRHGWGKVRAVPVAGLSVLRSFPTHRVDITAPGDVGRRRLRTPMVFVGNGIYDSSARGVPRRTSLLGGCLGVGIATTTGRTGLLRAALRSVRKGQPEDTEVEVIELAELTISANVARMKVALDGEVFKLKLPLEYRSRPQALRVLVPASVESDGRFDAEP